VGKLKNNAVMLALVMGLALSGMAQPDPGAERTDNNARLYREGNAWVEETTGTLPASRTLRVSTEVGTVRVNGGASGAVTYVVKKKAFVSSESAARREFDAFRISGAQRSDATILEGEFVQRGQHKLSADFQIQAPRDTRLLTIETRGGGINVNNIAGRVETETAGGGIQLDGIGGTIVANTLGGSIQLGNGSADAILKTAGGGITVESISGPLTATTYGGSMSLGTAGQSATLESMGGSIKVRQTAGDLRASTAGGNIEAGEIGGTAVLKTAGGSIRLGSAKGLVRASTAGGGITLFRLEKGVMAETAAGGITVGFTGSKGITESSLQTSAGDITLYLPASIACSVKAAIDMASGHRIRSDFPEVKVVTEGESYGPREVYAQGSLNGGGPTIKVRTGIGDIEILKAQK